LSLWEYFTVHNKLTPFERLSEETKIQQLLEQNLKLQKQIQHLERQINRQTRGTATRGSRGSPRKLAMKRNASTNNHKKYENMEREQRKSSPDVKQNIDQSSSEASRTLKPSSAGSRDRSRSTNNVPRLWSDSKNDT